MFASTAPVAYRSFFYRYIKLYSCIFCVTKPHEPFDDKWRKAVNWSPPEKKRRRGRPKISDVRWQKKRTEFGWRYLIS